MKVGFLKKIDKLNNCFLVSNLKYKKKKTYILPEVSSVRITQFLEEYLDKIQKEKSYNIIERFKFKNFLKSILPQIINKENYINEGKDSKVYAIDDKYVARIQKYEPIDSLIRFYNFVEIPSSRYSDIDLYYGSPVVQIGKIQILKNAITSKDYMICGLPYNKQDVSQQKIKEHEITFLKYCSELPQDSYNKFALGLRKFNALALKTNCYCNPDVFNPNNFIISNKEFRIVDKIENTICYSPNTLYTMLIPLLIKNSAYLIATNNDEVTNYRRIIYSKCVKASNFANLPKEDKIFLKAYYDKILNDILKNSNVN